MRFIVAALLAILFSVRAVAGEVIKGDWKFPSDIAVSNGKLYVVDGLNNRIAVYDLYGEHLIDLKVDSPYGIFVDNGLVYAVSQKGRLYVLDEYGELLKSFPLKGRPIDVVKLKDRLFVSNGEGNTVDVYTLDGKLVKRIGGKGTVPGNFVGVFLMDRGKNLIYVVDSVNARIQEFDEDGRFVRSFGVFGIEEGDLFRPKGIAVCNGYVAVSDGITGAVQLFDPYGGFENVIAEGLYYPTALSCYDGEVFVLEPLKNRVSTFRLRGVK